MQHGLNIDYGIYNPVIPAYIIGKNPEQKEQYIWLIYTLINVLP